MKNRLTARRGMTRLSATFCAAIAALTVTTVCPTTNAQTQPLDNIDLPIQFDSGVVRNLGDQRGVIFSDIINIGQHSSIRMMWDHATLGDAPDGGQPTILRLTSLLDGHVQHMTTEHLRQWMYTSAYFNGGRLQVEIIADPGAEPSRLASSMVMAGEAFTGELERSICFSVDDRELSNDPRAGRIVPIGCTGWIIDDPNRCFLTAGHCTGAADVVEFNVPLSNSNGTIVHPGPEDQYAVDPVSMQSNGGQGVGDDWAYFGCFPNTETGLTAFQAQGDNYVIVNPPPLNGQDIRITGYGTTSNPVPPQWNQVQKTHVGPFATSDGTLVQYQTDTTGGNSGSPVINEDTGLAIGIHTHGGCGSSGGANSGTGINHPALQNALANPQGVCIPLLLEFDYPNGRPSLVSPSGSTAVNVVVSGQEGITPQPGTGMLHYNYGDGYVAIPMTQSLPNAYEVNFPEVPCGTEITYYFSAETTEGEVITDPWNAPGSVYQALAADDIDIAWEDDFETNTGWTVSGNATDGQWERAIPAGGGDRGDPPTDADGSGNCYVTDNEDGNSDVDGGTTTLTSPTLDATDNKTLLTFYTWYDNTFGAAPMSDTFVIEISDDNGASWNELDTIGPTGDQVSGGWFFQSYDLAEVSGITPTNQMRVRFHASDLGDGSVVEAGVDGVMLSQLICDTGDDCPADLVNDDDIVNVDDMLQLLSNWGTDGLGSELAEPLDVVDVSDLLELLSVWGPC